MPPMMNPDGKVGHAEIMIGNSHIMLSDENPGMNAPSAKSLGGSACSLLIYTEDVDGMVQRAVNAGATIVRPLENQFYGDRTCNLEDPFGNQWYIHQHIEDVTPEEMERRMASMAGAQG
jgi:PhnB protein